MDGSGTTVAVAGQAVVEERQLLKSLRWYDGFVIALCNPGFLIGSLGFVFASVGVLGAIGLWGVSAAIGLMQVFVYSETAAMFPDKAGGISLYAFEGWRRYFSVFGPIAAFGYWIGWSVVLSIFGNLIGSLIAAQWFPTAPMGGTTPGYFSAGLVNIGLPQLIGIGIIIGIWAINQLGVKLTMGVGYVTGVLLMIPLAVFIVVPYFTGDWHVSNLTYVAVPGHSNFSVWMVWLFIMCWSAYGVEVCASFAPEYHDTKRDTALALRSSAVFCLAVFTLLPLGLGGVVGATGDSGAFYVSAFGQLVGHSLGGVALVLLIASLILSMNSATADAGRALYGISQEGMTIKQLGVLNKHHVPGRGMTVNMILNVGLILFVANNLAILYLSNIGYVFCHVLALSGFLLLRKDRPGWPRPIKLRRIWLVVAAVCLVLDATMLVFGLMDQDLVALLGGYQHSGGPFILGIGILVLSVVLFFYRRAVQDKMPITLRDRDTPSMPTEEQMALLQAEMAE
jgi:amino acid transporter